MNRFNPDYQVDAIALNVLTPNTPIAPHQKQCIDALVNGATGFPKNYRGLATCKINFPHSIQSSVKVSFFKEENNATLDWPIHRYAYFVEYDQDNKWGRDQNSIGQEKRYIFSKLDKKNAIRYYRGLYIIDSVSSDGKLTAWKRI